MKKLMIQASNPYFIYIGQHLLQQEILATICRSLNKRIAIITDTNLTHLGEVVQTRLAKQDIKAELFTMPAGEQYKTREVKQQLEDSLLAKKYGRDSCLIALGGGVISDLVGFLASTYCRGIPVIYIPTTLLAMVDASIGGKTAVNTSYGKNLIGSFCQPYAVIIDTQTLTSLPDSEFSNGMAEVIKHALIQDADLFYQLREYTLTDLKNNTTVLIDIIAQSSCIKQKIVQIDETEQGVRYILNFGHTIGHAIEMGENYCISHGEAVAIGLLVESYLSMSLGLLSDSMLSCIEKTLRQYGLKLTTTALRDLNQFKDNLILDKKSKQGIPRFVLLKTIGAVFVSDNDYITTISEDLLDQALAWAAGRFAC